MRVVFNYSASTYKNLLKKAGLPTMHNRQLHDLMVLMFNVKNYKVHPWIIPTKESNYNLPASDLVIPIYNTVTYGKHSIRYLGPYLWHKLPGNVQHSATWTVLKDKLRKWTWKVFCSRDVPLAVFFFFLPFLKYNPTTLNIVRKHKTLYFYYL